jgi:anti-sigma factor RsiW
MNCKKTQSCFFDYADGTMQQGKHSDIEDHLAGCTACRLYYDAQRRLQQSIKNAAASELAGIHFQPMTLSLQPSGAVRRPSIRMMVERSAYAMPALLLLFVVLWPLLKPVPGELDDPTRSGYAEAFNCLQMYSANSPGPSGFAAPVAVIVQPGVPARVIELDGTTDVTDELK